jgi:hypothetical protein
LRTRVAGSVAQFHLGDLHHAAASLLVADGLAIAVVSASLGHALTPTINTSAHALPGSHRLNGGRDGEVIGVVGTVQIRAPVL